MIEPHDAYWLFVAAVVVIVLAPGPDMAYMLTRTIAQGAKAGVVAAIGINVGAYVHVLAAVLGLSAILATSSVAFTVVKWVGACYLIWIGIQAFIGSAAMNLNRSTPVLLKVRTIFWQGFLSDVLNPKVALFYLAFLPQFVHFGTGSEINQLLFLGVTCNVIAIFINLMLVCLASAATASLRRNQKVTHWLNRAMGATLIALGIRLASEKL